MKPQPRYLTAEQERVIRQAIAAGATTDEAAAQAGIPRRRLETRLADQFADLRVGQGRRGRPRGKPRDPTPEEIAVECAKFRAAWPPERFGITRPFTISDVEGFGRATPPWA